MIMVKKLKVERKPMKTKRTRNITEEQREALRERMKLMRAKKTPAEYKNISKMVLNLPDEDTYSFKNIKAWIKHNKEMITALNTQSRSRSATDKERRTSENQAAGRKAYVRYCEYYLKTGDWISVFSGLDEEHKVVPRCVAMAYYSDGTPKRSVGVFYPDIAAVWTKNMNESEFGTSENYVPKIKKNVAVTDQQFIGEV
jgi:hypothetical protein